MNSDSFIAACDGEMLSNNDLYEINMFLTNYQYYVEKIRHEHYIKKGDIYE